MKQDFRKSSSSVTCFVSRIYNSILCCQNTHKSAVCLILNKKVEKISFRKSCRNHFWHWNSTCCDNFLKDENFCFYFTNTCKTANTGNEKNQGNRHRTWRLGKQILKGPQIGNQADDSSFQGFHGK